MDLFFFFSKEEYISLKDHLEICFQSTYLILVSMVAKVRNLQMSHILMQFLGQIANICWIMEKGREFQKNYYFCFIDYAKAFDCVNHNKLWKILKFGNFGNTRPPDLPLEKPIYRSGSNS